MKLSKLLLLLLVIPLFAFTSFHKYYISVTQVNYIKEKQSLQITSRIFIDDFENVLKNKYDKNLVLAGDDEPKIVDSYIEKYLKEKLTIKINKENVKIIYIGKEYDGDIMRCYLEVENVNNIKSIEISNQVLFDMYKAQQNIVKTKINSQQKSAILSTQDKNVVLNFN
ncbi:hypothetical protein SAMN05428642_103332 [Flaviramulus basaltis]|uniref:Peptidase E n=1 Tax=Flaviramulus basaltis TaxID=369401 RepID=A0A1K2INJ3_9FLAO|nr:DUF6702 family protein [Flaviramulus basaltis]SFZ93784.1 hypothetical protein SAMN05428642_103332 [Flaviramulus basaltis]